jgi:hypothetical protein
MLEFHELVNKETHELGMILVTQMVNENRPICSEQFCGNCCSRRTGRGYLDLTIPGYKPDIESLYKEMYADYPNLCAYYVHTDKWRNVMRQLKENMGTEETQSVVEELSPSSRWRSQRSCEQ